MLPLFIAYLPKHISLYVIICADINKTAYTVGTYVRSQLNREAGAMDRIFAQQNTPEVEKARKQQLQVETNGDPRNNLFNFLGWS